MHHAIPIGVTASMIILGIVIQIQSFEWCDGDVMCDGVLVMKSIREVIWNGRIDELVPAAVGVVVVCLPGGDGEAELVSIIVVLVTVVTGLSLGVQ